MRSETLHRKTYLNNNNGLSQSKRSTSLSSADFLNNNVAPCSQATKRSSSLSSDTLDTLIPVHLLANGTEPDVKRSSSLTSLCAMFTEWDGEEFLEKFYSQLLEIEGRVCSVLFV